MSQEKIISSLTTLGLSKLEAQIYTYLAKRDPKKASEIGKSLNLIKQQVYPTIKKLQSKGLVTSTFEHPARFSAVPFRKMLDLCIKAKLEEAKTVQRNMNELISDWESIKTQEQKDSTPKFSVIEGRNNVYSRFEQMIRETKKQFSIITSIPNLLGADQFGVIDAAKNCLNEKVRFRFITELHENEINAIKKFLEKNQLDRFQCEGRIPDLGQKLKNQILIKDETEAIFFIDSLEKLQNGKKDSNCLWTNSKTLIEAFTSLFNELWRNSTDIKEKILEIETGKPSTKTTILNDKIESEKKFNEILKSAKKEVIMITTLDDFVYLSKNIILTENFGKQKITHKIMVPITVENFQIARKLSEHFNIRHIPESYLRTTLVDDLHLFQFKTSISDKKNERTKFENAFYTTDFEYIEKTKTMLKELWDSASELSSITLNSTTMFNNTSSKSDGKSYDVYRKTVGYVSDQLGLISEKDLLEKIGHQNIPLAKNPSKDITIMYGNGARALINPPKHLKLPRMMVTVLHCNEKSTFGKENWLAIHVPKMTPKGEIFLPAALIGDNPQSVDWRRRINEGTSLENNLPLVKEDELQVRGQGNVLFAGWTVPIDLGFESKVVPPSCLFFEGYRELGIGIVESKATLTRMQKTEFYGYESFVTFFHPSSKYSGPGTDGVIFRDIIITSSPKT